ncbi:helix-turn-helix domain-containing protein [Pararhodobacter sp.]|uniref:helix-turn-helix domain-containing protein n=1 Tax=Pararhodobacter sp. TaxID=2127056 RepID=UPI002FDD6CFF
MTTAQELGTRLRKFRRGQQLTLSDLAEVSGVALSTISKIENGSFSPTLDKVLRLAKGLNITITQLIGEDDAGTAEPPPNSRLALARADDGIVLDTENYEYRYLCSELKNKRMLPIRARIKASTIQEFGPLERHGGEEFFVVLEGTIEVHTEFYAPVTLQRGEGIYIDSTMGHAYLSAGDVDAEAICICTEMMRPQDAG